MIIFTQNIDFAKIIEQCKENQRFWLPQPPPNRPKTPQDRPKMPKDRPKTPQERQKAPQERPKTDPKIGQDRRKTPRQRTRAAQEASKAILPIFLERNCRQEAARTLPRNLS